MQPSQFPDTTSQSNPGEQVTQIPDPAPATRSPLISWSLSPPGTHVPAVPMSPRIASVLDRFFAFFVEAVIYILFIVAWWTVAIFVFDQSLVESYETQDFWWNADGTTSAGTSRTWTLGDSRAGWLGWLVYCIYFVWSEVKYGQTLGKRFIGLHVVDARTGARPSVTQSILRLVFFHIGSFALFIPTWIIMLASEKNQRTGDSVAKTLVVYK